MNIFQVIANNEPESVRSNSRKVTINLFGKKIRHSQELHRIQAENKKKSRRSKIGKELLKKEDLAFLENYYQERSKSQVEGSSLKLHKKYVISDQNRFKRIFDAFMKLLVVVSIIFTLYFLAFQDQDYSFMIFDTVIWVFFVIDFLLTFISEISDAKGRRVRNLYSIASNYAKSWMIFDLLSILPLRYTNNPNAEYFLRLFRIFKANRIFSIFNITEFSSYLSNLLYKSESQSKKRFRIHIEIAWEIAVQIVKMLFFTYILACLWYYYVMLIYRKEEEPKYFITNFDLENDTQLKRFIVTWYFMFTTLVTVGYGDYYATNKFEMVFAIILLLAGPTWFAFMMGKGIHLLNSLKDVSGFSNRKQKVSCWINSIERKYTSLHPEMKEKIINHFLYHMRNDRLGPLAKLPVNEDIDSFKKQESIISQLPNELKQAVLQHLFSDVLFVFRDFFAKTGKAKFELCYYLQPRLFMKNDTILEYDKDIYEIFFILSGSYSIGIKLGEIFTKVYSIYRPSIIGEVYLFCKSKSFAEYKASSIVRSFAIPAYALEYFIKKYSLNFRNYCRDMSAFYDDIKTKVNKEISLNREETEEDRRQKVLRNSIGTKKFLGSIMSCYIENQVEEVHNFSEIYEHIHSFDQKIITFNKKRNESIKKLKGIVSEVILCKIQRKLKFNK